MAGARRRQSSRDAAQRCAFASTHAVLGVENGAFVSLADPPEPLRAAAACAIEGTWPVLAGGEAAPRRCSPLRQFHPGVLGQVDDESWLS